MLIENVDYFVRVLPFPNGANLGAVFPNADGTFDVYLNSRYTDLTKGYDHEVNHLLHDHFAETGKTIAQLEAEADGIFIPAPDTKTIPLFNSLEAFRDFMLPQIEKLKSEHPEIKFA